MTVEPPLLPNINISINLDIHLTIGVIKHIFHLNYALKHALYIYMYTIQAMEQSFKEHHLICQSVRSSAYLLYSVIIFLQTNFY